MIRGSTGAVCVDAEWFGPPPGLDFRGDLPAPEIEPPIKDSAGKLVTSAEVGGSGSEVKRGEAESPVATRASRRSAAATGSVRFFFIKKFMFVVSHAHVFSCANKRAFLISISCSPLMTTILLHCLFFICQLDAAGRR